MKDTKRLYGGFDRDELLTELVSDQNITAEPVKANQIGVTSASYESTVLVYTDTISAATANSVTLTIAGVNVGDIIKFTSGVLTGLEIKVKAVNGLLVTLVNKFSSIPSPSDSVNILRYSSPIINEDGSTNVVILNPGGSSNANTNVFNEVSSVAAAINTTILTYVIPSTTGFFFFLAEVTGTNIANYSILIDAVLVARKYTYFGGELNADFDFEGLKLTTGQIITINVIHNRPSLGDFSARIVGNLS